jgi:RNA polymerase sigma-70 factor (ECF subfamily)
MQLIDAAALRLAANSALLHADDATLARALIAGDAHAPRVAWGRFSPMVRGMLRRTLGPEFDVDDVLQDVFLCLFQNVKNLREPGALRAFVMSITVRTVRHEIRRRRIRRWVGLGDDGEVPDLRVVSPDTDSREALVRFYRVLDKVGTRDRTAFVLYFIEGLDAASVALNLSVSVPTVRRCLARSWKRVVLLAGRDPALAGYVERLKARGETQ